MTASAPDVVLMKFCYVDVTEDSDVTSVLAAYAGVVDTHPSASSGRAPGTRDNAADHAIAGMEASR